ncbi:MAG: hypothetical protein JRJ12_07050 [Deltaproteobacteria bacterium]|nr:hypothetical protein [Deltaproteobacteria bacterium]MBW2071138.1 hypothetical protein [Deltaproteobacteria bacterium]
MAEIIHLESVRLRQAANRGFKNWARHFSDKLDETTRIVDLSDETLAFLVSPEEQRIFLLYDFIMGVRQLGKGSDFFSLDKTTKMEVVDVSIFLLDQLRFECMHRLRWLVASETQRLPIVQLASQYESRPKGRRPAVPELHPSHPRYYEFRSLTEFEREPFIRRMIPAAVQQFISRVSG